ncbi:hypothetical protein [Microbulbifer sp. TRSA005]|uniref:hypothetical protein n=1 Tax=unclassified Microbulbifer TaxID=2619833 RepID=UPI0040397BB4
MPIRFLCYGSSINIIRAPLIWKILIVEVGTIDEEHLSDVISGNVECDAFVVLVEGGIAGIVTIEQAEIVGMEMPELSDIFVLPKYRNQRVASKIVRVLCLRKPGSGI